MSGQVFRWKETGKSRWLGVDGDSWYHVSVAGSGEYEIETNADRGSFERLFRLDEDTACYETQIRQIAPELAPYMDRLRGLRLMKPVDVVEETFCFLCTPNNNLARILKMSDFLARQGHQLVDDVWRFPPVEEIANLPESTLREAKFGYRAATIPAIAKQVVERGGEKWLLSLRERPYCESHQELVSLKGVGAKLADCICLFALHHTEAVPVDTHLWQASVRHYFPELKGQSLTDKRYRMIGDYYRERFGKLAGWAHQYLFYDNLQNWRSYQKR